MVAKLATLATRARVEIAPRGASRPQEESQALRAARSIKLVALRFSSKSSMSYVQSGNVQPPSRSGNCRLAASAVIRSTNDALRGSCAVSVWDTVGAGAGDPLRKKTACCKLELRGSGFKETSNYPHSLLNTVPISTVSFQKAPRRWKQPRNIIASKREAKRR